MLCVCVLQVDRLFQWQSNPHGDIANTLKKQRANTKLEFDERVEKIKVQFAEQVRDEVSCLAYINTVYKFKNFLVMLKKCVAALPKCSGPF